MSPLSFSGSPLFLNAYNTVGAFLEANGWGDIERSPTKPAPMPASETGGGGEAGNEEDQVDEAQALIDRILNWAKSHAKFDTSFVDGMQQQYEDKGLLSEKQLAALRNIISKWHID